LLNIEHACLPQAGMTLTRQKPDTVQRINADKSEGAMERLSDERMSSEKVRSCDGTTKRKNENEENPAKS
jgi:hypothetical protein